MLAVVYKQTKWYNAAPVVYAFVLGILRLVNDLKWRHLALHQVNFLLTTSLFTFGAATLLPCIETESRCYVPDIVTASIACLAAAFLIAFLTPREWVPPSLDSSIPAKAHKSEPAPEETCSWFNYYLAYEWLTPLIWKGSRGTITVDDLPSLAWYDDPALMLEKVKVARAKGKTTLWTVIYLMKKEISLMAFWISSSYITELSGPFAMYKLLEYIADPEGAIVQPWVWLILMFCGPMSRSVCFQQYVFTSTRLIVRIKSALTQELYHRAVSSMELEEDIFATKGSDEKKDARKAKNEGSTSAGRLANLMAADVDAIYGSRDIVMIATGVPVGTIVALFGLYKILGWPSLIGAVILLLASPISIGIAQRMGAAQRKVRKAQDTRISLVSEYLSLIRAVKYFAWEDAVIENVAEARKAEQGSLWVLAMHYVTINQIVQLVPYIALLVMFTLHVTVMNQTLTSAVAFTVISLVRTIRRNVTQAGMLSRHVTSAMIALSRLDRYFDSTVPIEKFPEGQLQIQKATFRRNKLATFQLQDIDLEFVDGGLNAVTGQSGSGKTTLLLSILGETVKESGLVVRPNDVAFASQTSWLQNDTIRNNIVFNSPFEQTRYSQIVQTCCLPYDFNELADGDMTVVGENGASLSGGQRARVALARALYSKAPLLLLDDIFSALDAKTAASLWEQCFCSDLLKSRTTVLVTNLPWIASQSDLSIVLENGTIKSVEQNLGIVRKAVTVTNELMGHIQEEPEPELVANGDALNDRSKVPKDSKQTDDISQEMKATGNAARLQCKIPALLL
jgi:ABC-type multidrug transport system fused ATPase/permease subunit